MSHHSDEDINTIKKKSSIIEEDGDGDNLSQNSDNKNEEIYNKDDLENIPENSQISDGEEKGDTDTKAKTEKKQRADYEKAKTKEEDDDEDKDDEKEDFADVEISSGSSNSVYL
jgi:hypothetical protein